MEWVGRVDDEALGLVPDCSVIQAEMAVLLLRRSWRALCQRRVNIRVVLQQPDATTLNNHGLLTESSPCWVACKTGVILGQTCRNFSIFHPFIFIFSSIYLSTSFHSPLLLLLSPPPPLLLPPTRYKKNWLICNKLSWNFNRLILRLELLENLSSSAQKWDPLI